MFEIPAGVSVLAGLEPSVTQLDSLLVYYDEYINSQNEYNEFNLDTIISMYQSLVLTESSSERLDELITEALRICDLAQNNGVGGFNRDQASRMIEALDTLTDNVNRKQTVIERINEGTLLPMLPTESSYV